MEPSKLLKPPGEVHYLPHHPVIRSDKTTPKLRIAYDDSSAKEGPSLNQCLETEANLLPRLTDILVRFNSYKVAYISDIKQAFLNVSINESYCDFLRFLWVKDISSDPFEILVRRFTRLAFGTTVS